MKWLLHNPVEAEEINKLGAFADNVLSGASGISGKELSQKLSRSDAKGLERELLEYWERNIPAFAEAELIQGLRRLTLEVQEDLRNL